MTRFLWSLALLAGCAASPLQPAPEKLEPWTASLRDRQPDGAYAAVYRAGRQRLLFLAAVHENREDSPTFGLIRDSYARFAIDTAIVEGVSTSAGPNPPRLLRYAAAGEAKDGFVAGGETVPAVLGARREGATLWGGEPDDLEIKSRILGQGFRAEDLLGYYVLRNIPQWIRERQLEHAGAPPLRSLVEAALTRNRAALELPPTVLPGFAEWSAWYRALNGRPIGAGFTTEETGPLSDGRFGTNRIAAAVSRARDEHLHRLVIEHLNAGKTVLVVFGGSHFMIHRPALDAVLGSPCYVGTALERAASACR